LQLACSENGNAHVKLLFFEQFLLSSFGGPLKNAPERSGKRMEACIIITKVI
jgi:hypothetical protein